MIAEQTVAAASAELDKRLKRWHRWYRTARARSVLEIAKCESCRDLTGERIDGRCLTCEFEAYDQGDGR